MRSKIMARNISMRLLPAILLVSLAWVGGIFAQGGGTGAITGVVSDSTGAVVRGATVTLTSKVDQSNSN